VPIEDVIPSPMQPRTEFVDEHIDELVESIREKGIIQPLIVRDVDGQLELIAGERRWRASQKLGLEKVKVIIREATDKEVLEMALIENLQREDLNPIEEARAYHRLAADYGMKQEEIASSVGKNRATVANAIRLLDLDVKVQAMVEGGKLSVGHAKVILGLPTATAQLEAANEIVANKLSVRNTERLVAGLLNPKPKVIKGADLDPHFQQALVEVEDKLQKHFGSRAKISHAEKKGKIEIEYYGLDDLNRILETAGLDIDALTE